MNIKLVGIKNELAGRPGKPELTMKGGNLELTDFVWWGDYDDIEAYWYHSGGTVTVANEFELGWGPGTGGAGTLDMTGGTITAGRLVVPTSSGAYGNFFLRGGTFTVRESGGLRMNANGLIDITDGVLVLEGDETARVNNFIARGQIIAYGGIGTVLVTYSGQRTTVTALGSPRASNPKPADEATDVLREVVLGWTSGIYVPSTNGHKVYFSDNFNDVKGGIGGVAQDVNSYTPPQLLDFGTTYYWRVDEVNGPPDHTVYQGDVWSFTTEPFAYPIQNITATASSQFNANTGPENTINSSGLDDNDLHSTDETGLWISNMTGPQPTWIQYDFDRVYKLHQMWVWNYNSAIEPVVGFGIKDATIEYSTDSASWTTLGTHEFARASGAASYAYNTTVDFGGVVAKYVKITANSNFGSILPQYGLSEVRFLYVPVLAREPNPASGAADADVDGVLSWRAGREAATHNVYISADEQAVIDETISPVSILASGSYANHATGPLDLGQSYYWKVNEVNEAETPVTWQGDVWNFSTQQYLVVDDFEDYNDFEPDRIFDTWVDGWGDPANGSQVGSAEPPFAGWNIVHSGEQSMPLHYDNSTTSYSEATANVANLPVGRDWTKYGIKTLSLWFYGDPTNAAELMYMKINGVKVVYGGDVTDIQSALWHEWNIELSSFGVNLSNVTELSIGLERSGVAGGSGVVYFDDIRLYP